MRPTLFRRFGEMHVTLVKPMADRPYYSMAVGRIKNRGRTNQSIRGPGRVRLIRRLWAKDSRTTI